MTQPIDNPFHELFVTDSAPPEEYVRYFSPFLVPHSLELFREGNVILKGTQGCGKSMLLKLFQPQIRSAYASHNQDFPVPSELRSFIGAGVNLSKSGLLDIAQKLSAKPQADEYQQLTHLFTDFLNYWLLRDLLRSLKHMAEDPKLFDDMVAAKRFDDFVEEVRKEDCWFGYLDRCRTLSDLEARVAGRILAYRKWLGGNDDQLDAEILSTKTTIGEPLSKTAECLKNTRVIGPKVPIFLRIDQLEELWHREEHQAELTRSIRRVINRVIGNRDLRVSFRIGTRRYSWDDDLAMPGGRKIEEDRDYLVVDLDQKLRRNEDRSGWLFEGFATDVFCHRLDSNTARGGKTKGSRALLDYFGHSPTPQQLIEHLIVSPPEDPQKLLKLDAHWTPEWRLYIHDIYHKKNAEGSKGSETAYSKDPLNALLVAAWGLQTGGAGSKAVPRRGAPPPQKFPPWTKWWFKERAMLAVMQLVVRHQQTLFWWGSRKILALSSSNITLFLSICREIWDQWQRRAAQEFKSAKNRNASNIGWKIQAVAIDNASKRWHRNFSRQPGRPAGDVRMRFVDELGSWLRRGLLTDEAMSYPGGNGFSLRQSDLEKNPQLYALLAEAVGWGDLYEVEHTTKISKEKHRDPRKKFYLNPILSPHYQISDAHTKEPIYARLEQIQELARKSGVLAAPTPTRSNPQQEELSI